MKLCALFFRAFFYRDVSSVCYVYTLPRLHLLSCGLSLKTFTMYIINITLSIIKCNIFYLQRCGLNLQGKYDNIHIKKGRQKMLKEKIKALFTMRNKTQIEYAKHIDRTRQSLSNTISNDRMNLGEFIKLCDWMGLKINIIDKTTKEKIIELNINDIHESKD